MTELSADFEMATFTRPFRLSREVNSFLSRILPRDAGVHKNLIKLATINLRNDTCADREAAFTTEINRGRKNPRRVFTDIGIDAYQAETIAQHAQGMRELLAYLPLPHGVDRAEAVAMIDVWEETRAAIDEPRMSAKDFTSRECRTLHDTGADILYYNDPARAGLAHVLNSPEQDLDPAEFDHKTEKPQVMESAWVHELDYMQTARYAHALKAGNPQFTGKLTDLIDSCQRALLTKAGRAEFETKLFSAAAPPLRIVTVEEASNEGLNRPVPLPHPSQIRPPAAA